MTLHTNKALFKTLIKAVAKSMGVKEHLIEKDYWVTYAVKTLFASRISDKIVFKGGTSLSKCYRAISRFSEDIDICLANCENDTRALRRRRMKRVTKTLSEVLPEIEMPTTRKGEMIRTTYHAYDYIHPATALGQVKDHIKLEVIQLGHATPCQMGTMRSYIADHLDHLGDHATIATYGLEAFPVRVLGLERTFAEKVACLVQYAHVFDRYKALGDRIRHAFDLHELLKRQEIVDYMAHSSFAEMLAEVKKEAWGNYRENNMWLTVHPSKALIFEAPLATLKKIPPSSKEGFSLMLIKREMPSDEVLAMSLSAINDILKEISWHALEEQQAEWVNRTYRKMKVHLPYDGVYTRIVVAKDQASIAGKKQKHTLYIFPMDSSEQTLSKLVELAKRDHFPLQVDAGYSATYPVPFKSLQKLAVLYRVELLVLR